MLNFILDFLFGKECPHCGTRGWIEWYHNDVYMCKFCLKFIFRY